MFSLTAPSRPAVPGKPHIIVGVWFFAILLPFVVTWRNYPILSFYREWVAIFLALAAAVLVFAKARRESYTWPFAAWIPLALLPSVLYHWLAGNPLIIHGPPLYLASIASAILLMILGRWLATSRPGFSLMDVIATALLVAALASSVASWHWRFDAGLFEFPSWGVARGFIGQYNQNGLHLWLGIVGLGHFYLRRRMRWPFFLLALAILVEAAILSGSRSVYLYAGGGLVLAVWAAFRTARHSMRRRLLLLGVLPVLFIGVTLGVRGLSQQDVGAVERYAPEVVARDGRIGHWLSAWYIVEAQPWLGAGPGSFIRESWVVSDRVPAGVHAPLPASHAHNMFINLGAELGAPTALIVAALLATWFFSVLRQSAWQRQWLSVALPLAVLTHNQVEFTLWYLYYLIPTALTMGAAVSRLPGVRLPACTGAVLLATSLLGLGVSAKLGRDYRHLAELRNDPYGTRIERLLDAAQHPVFGAWASAEIARKSWSGAIAPELQDFHASRALYVSPYYGAVLLRHVDALKRAGRYTAADKESLITGKFLDKIERESKGNP